MTNSRRKGATYEREVASELRAAGLTARRGQQYSGANGDSDVICEELPGIHLELKRRKQYISAADLYSFMDQAKGDARPGQKAVVIHRIDGQKSLATMQLEEWIALAKEGEKR